MLTEGSSPNIRELHIFDFDGTLFKSPSQPEGVNGENWWPEPRSLEPPCVPDSPTSEWFNTNVTNALKTAIAKPDVYTVLMTGRVGAVRPQVIRIMRSVGVEPDEYILNDTGNSVEKYKTHEMKYLLKNFPLVHTVHFWEDRGSALKNYERQAHKAGMNFVPHFVNEPHMEAGCSVEDLEQD
jgi:hypothetical protein